jgi:hypothetical protein
LWHPSKTCPDTKHFQTAPYRSLPKFVSFTRQGLAIFRNREVTKVRRVSDNKGFPLQLQVTNGAEIFGKADAIIPSDWCSTDQHTLKKILKRGH